MGKITKFEDLEIWKKGMRLTVKIYQIMQKCRDFSFKDQIQRAAVSIPSNISEGYERQTNKGFVQFLYIAKGSCAELRAQLYLAKEFEYVEIEDFQLLIEESKLLSAMLNSLIRVRKNNF